MTKTKTSELPIMRITHVLDAQDQVLGRLAAKIAHLLMGKHKVSYAAHTDCGDFVLVKNVSAIKVTGTKLTSKTYPHFSQYAGGLKQSQLSTEMDKNPARVLRRAVERMLPRNRLRLPRIKRLKIEGEKGSKRIW